MLIKPAAGPITQGGATEPMTPGGFKRSGNDGPWGLLFAPRGAHSPPCPAGNDPARRANREDAARLKEPAATPTEL